MVSAMLALIGLLLSAYLTLWRYGFMGPLQCGTGGCETVQTSEWASILGIPVAVIGLVGYAALLGVSLWGLQPRWVERREPTVWLLVLSGGGVLFTLYLKYLEAFVINAWCRWCIASAVIIAAIFVTAVVGWRGMRQTRTNGNT
jgi:uncharacterized membrane protein